MTQALRMPEAVRRTQKERRDTTRAALLEGAITSLCETGLARFTTTDVCARAGLSQGALFRYFPTKASLLAATSEHLFDGLRSEFEARFQSLPPGRRSIHGGLALLWQSMRDPRLAAAYELYTAARTDAALRDALEPIVRTHVGRIQELADSLLPARAGLDGESLRSIVDLAILSMQGLVINQMALPDPEQEKRLLRLLDTLSGSFTREEAV